MVETDSIFMEFAISLAAKGLYTSTPNPRVGCVIVAADGRIVGQGYHRKAGEAHAEVNALLEAGELSRGATAYVSLEPCVHHGRTGPCVEALLAAGVSTIVYGTQDPNPKVSGAGIAQLRAAGVEVRGPVLEHQARALNPGFNSRMERGRPWLRCKLAMSIDGRTAMANGESRWVTGDDARADVQLIRARSCAIVTGADTVIMDNPAMTVRDLPTDDEIRQPQRFVVDSQARISGQERIFTEPGACWLVRTEASKSVNKATPPSIIVADKNGKVDLWALQEHLAQQGINELLLESGPALAGAYLAEGLIDELIIFMAGKLMGSSGRPLFELPLQSMSEAVPLEVESIEPLGEDWKITAFPKSVKKN